MAQKIDYGYRKMLDEALSVIRTVDVAQAKSMQASGDVQLIDLRDPRELEREGQIPGAFHCPRGMLEFWIDPASPYHKPVFAQDKTFVFFCAAGWRSALSAHTAQKMGLKPVAHIDGGFAAWRDGGGEVEKVERKG